MFLKYNIKSFRKCFQFSVSIENKYIKSHNNHFFNNTNNITNAINNTHTTINAINAMNISNYSTMVLDSHSDSLSRKQVAYTSQPKLANNENLTSSKTSSSLKIEDHTNINLNNIIDGKLIASKIKQRLKDEIQKYKNSHLGIPGLALILVGNRQDSTKYVTSKKLTAEEIGMNSFIYNFDESVSNEEILNKIKELNEDRNVHGIVVQLPLPPTLNKKKILDSIHPLKDVDGFQTNTSATALAVMDLLDSKGITIEGKNAVIIGRSMLVGKPIADRLLERNATITICHSKTPIEELKRATKCANIIVSACGVPKLIKKDFLQPECVIIDVGISRMGNEIVGDVDFENCKDICKAITPVPGGVGPMTVCKLMDQTMEAFKKLNNIPTDQI